ncbi:rhodanese-related sulfurtransferase [Tumebacillus sp. BK434]|uniref:rhodanese-like domain-containing protein n=1 Tax=Tumebacillus sp. BK434 TaxID=2512169 RepID=UPI001053A68B|nr:rhodanese-like domain-containing protein [Tumebacillus sp. BK434]TCP52676.1 rhodanese-related sulfurtransferase [Tumebacillus sp. BK434]
MEYVQYLFPALILWFLLSRMLPVRGLAALTAQDVQERLAQQNEHVYVDVREVHEYGAGHIKGFQNIPLSQLKARIGELPKDKSIVLTCRSGMRSRQAAKILSKHGFSQLAHLKTGVTGWNGQLTK